MDALATHQLQVERIESHRANQVYALTTQPATGGEDREHRANQVYVLTTQQLQVERRERHRANQVYALTTHQLQVERKSHSANQVRVYSGKPFAKLRLAIGKANCGAPQLPTRDG